MVREAPVIREEASEARKMMAPMRSSTSPTGPRKMRETVLV
jgi:hypothetical protein